jgi:hypothetical protein
MDVAKITKAYVAIRDRRAEIKKAFDTEYADLGEKLARLSAELLRLMQNQNSDAIRTEFGTVYRQEEVKPSCSDWSALDAWEKANPDINASDILEKRVSKKFITEYMENNDGALPPGISIYREYVARVRRS